MTVDLITLKDPRSAAAEAFRTLRTNLMFSKLAGDKPLHTLLLTSPATSDDKSMACANLAVTFAQAGHKTILVDADLRRPAQHEIWNISNERGLMTLMLEESAMANPPLVPTEIDGLSILPSGPLPSVPADVLSNPRMGEVIGVLKARADYIIFDASPVLAASDAALLGSKVDGVLLVVRAGNTRRDHVSQAKQALEQVRAFLIGAVLTNAPQERTKNY
ncbi:MAG: polysaccharide biosynthesis tyrosine autokinase [Chloroflexi bacterium AL-W]|nr:polysaccharide biosynthesis tyrosine autokinase [Chloroflexi bacterium AL-W]